MAMNTRVPSILFAVIAIAAAVTFLSLNVDLAIASKDNDLKILDTNPDSNNNMISPNPVSNSNYTNPSSSFNTNPVAPSSSFNTNPNPVSNTTKPSLGAQDQFNLDQFNQCVKQKTVDSNGKLSLSSVAVCYGKIFSNKLQP
ncbi:MAG: hypothetical protein JO327_07300 [Nitrososphaeraceae archaeon]|nr:hypothetical protein [Nitrososphaeraceae archaeon]